jgi:hypothetical protein
VYIFLRMKGRGAYSLLSSTPCFYKLRLPSDSPLLGDGLILCLLQDKPGTLRSTPQRVLGEILNLAQGIELSTFRVSEAGPSKRLAIEFPRISKTVINAVIPSCTCKGDARLSG